MNYPFILGALGTFYAVSLSAFRFITHESSSVLDGWSHILKCALCLPLARLIETSSHKDLEVLNIGCCALEVLLMYQVYKDLVSGPKFRMVDLSKRVYIVTGSNTGIGFETAKELVRMGATVVLACRSIEKAKEAKDSIVAATNCSETKVLVIKLDLCGFDSVRKFVKEFHDTGFPLHGLINNAGVMMSERSLTQDGFETVFTANHLSHFLLTLLLLPDLEKTDGRVVNLTSALHKIPSGFDFDDIMSEKNYSLFGTYSQSKLANVLFTLELQRRLLEKGSKVTSNCVHPGLVRTEVTRNMNFFMRLGNQLFAPVLLALQKTPSQGAYCSIHVATNPMLEGLGGLYFVNSTPSSVGKGALDLAAAKRLWELSEKLTGVKF